VLHALLPQELTPTLSTRIVRASSSMLYKPIFNSAQEHEIYAYLTQIFPNHLVVPNAGLQAIFQYEPLRRVLDRSDFDYYLRAQVDYLVTSSANYLPICGIEVDSDWHDTTKQQARDERKDRIFTVGGIPLLRVRKQGSPSFNAVRQDLQEAVRNLGPDLWKSAREAAQVLGGMGFLP
jgi:hypothetical protein